MVVEHRFDSDRDTGSDFHKSSRPVRSLIVDNPGRQRVRGVLGETDEDPKSEEGKRAEQVALEVSHAACPCVVVT
jgi:hypothetical protein